MDFYFELSLDFLRVVSIPHVGFQTRPNSFDHGAAPTIPLRQRRKGLTEPVSDGNHALGTSDIRPNTAVDAGFLGDQFENQQGIAGTLRGGSNTLDQVRKVGSGGRCRRPPDRWRAVLEKIRLMEHIRNLAQAQAM